MNSAIPYKLAAISHIMLGVSSLPASLSFYRDLLGLELVFESPGFAFLRGGGVTLCLSEPMWSECGRSAGATEIVFGVDDVEAAHLGLSQQGIEFTHAPRQVTADQWAANFADPDGHRLSIFGPPSK